MYLHLGNNISIKTNSIIGVFDLEKATIGKTTKDFLRFNEKKKRVINISKEIPKSFIVCDENNEMNVYISQISTNTLLKRSNLLIDKLES